MILIADSGSTKCDWVLLRPDGQTAGKAQTMGFNPFFHDSKTITRAILEEPLLASISRDITAVYFYGAGCSSDSQKHIVKKGLVSAFPNASATVGHDLLGAAYALYDGEPLFCAILGTGSNACFFDGKETRKLRPALGYVLGDEGSGSWFGKKLITAFMYETLPPDLAGAFENTYRISTDDILENIYKKPHANVFLAGFAPFLSQHRHHPFVHDLLIEGMKAFLETHIGPFAEEKTRKVSFTGSVAWHFRNELIEACSETGLAPGMILQKPVDRLADYHRALLLSK